MKHESQDGWINCRGKIFYKSKYYSDVFLSARKCRKLKLTRVVHGEKKLN